MEKVWAERSASHYRPYMVEAGNTYNSDSYEIGDIIVYKDGMAILRTGQGWFEEIVFKGNKKTVNKDIQAIQITMPKRANKVNLHRKDNYIVKEKKDYKINNSYCLYIHADDIGEIKTKEWHFYCETPYQQVYKPILEVNANVMKEEYYKDDSGRLQRCRKGDNKFLMWDRHREDVKEKDNAEQKRRVIKKLEKVNVRINPYDLDEFLKYFKEK